MKCFISEHQNQYQKYLGNEVWDYSTMHFFKDDNSVCECGLEMW